MSKQFQQQKIYSDFKLKAKYDIMAKIGEGCFGSIYKAINRQKKKQIALKIQYFKHQPENSDKKSSLANQIFVLDKLKHVQGVPLVYSAGRWSFGYYLELQLLSSDLYSERKKEFTQTQIYLITAQLIRILKNIHQKNVIHQDLKPQNIMRNKEGSFVIIDYGLSNYSVQSKKNNRRGFVGTPRYASLAAHRGQTQRPKDDIQSLLYVIGSIYMKKAPWFQLKGPVQKRLQKIQQIKRKCSENWFHQCGIAFQNAYDYIMKLSQDQKIDYSYLINLFQSTRRTYVIKTLKFEDSQIVKNRRKSGTEAQNYLLGVPIINLHLIDRNTQKKNNRVQCSQLKIRDGYENSKSNQFSQIAQDGYKQYIQFLTQTLFKSFQQQETPVFDQSQINQITSNEPFIRKPSNVCTINFKNPFIFK